MPILQAIERSRPSVRAAAPLPRSDTSVSPVCRLLDERTEGEFQAYIDRHPNGTLFHGLAWKRAVESAFGHIPHYLLVQRNGEVAGVLPLFEVRSLVAGRFFVSVPYATYGGVLADDERVAQALIGAAEEIARNRSARSIELRNAYALAGAQAAARSHATFERTLPDSPDSVLGWIPRKARAAARRAAERYGLEVEFREGGGLDELWGLYSRSMRRLGSPNYPLKFFRELAQNIDSCVELVRYRGRPVAGLLTFFDRGRALPYFSGIDERLDLYGLSNFLYWQSMVDAVRRGCGVYDFGRTRVDNTGPFDFKRSFGFEPRPLGYQTIVMPGHRAPNLSPALRRWSVARRVWKKLPLGLTRPLGAVLAKSIPG